MVEQITKRAAAQEVVKVIQFGKYFGIVMIVGFFLTIGLKDMGYGLYGAAGSGLTIAMAYTVMAHNRINQLQKRWSLTSPTSTQKAQEIVEEPVQTLVPKKEE